ncbi:hypothetical protein KCP78_06575 [Salmonella enterica subsp. enterica]|nr:hypothetical protein KCP78_06575 [Salmonella enterica subsp. enterica]
MTIFMYAVHVFATGETPAYYNDFAADAPKTPRKSGLASGFAYQGEISPQTGEPAWRKYRANPRSLQGFYSESRSGVGNRARGDRLDNPSAGAERNKKVLLATSCFHRIFRCFMGEEYGESRPFCTDFHGDFSPRRRMRVCRSCRGKCSGPECARDLSTLKT